MQVAKPERSVPPVCAHCGAAVDRQLFVREGEAYCCERCLLERRLAAPEMEGVGDLYARFVGALTEALDMRERETGLHSKRVACHTQVLARRFIRDAGRLQQIYWGALLHDIGKIGVPDRILLKQAPLTPTEWNTMQSHAELGYHIVAKLPGMDEAADLVRCHEERYDGSGYPRGLKGEDIPFGARLFAVIDTLDAMTSDRPYRAGVPFEAAKAEITRLAGIQFDPAVVEAFLAEETVLSDMVALKCTHDIGGGGKGSSMGEQVFHRRRAARDASGGTDGV